MKKAEIQKLVAKGKAMKKISKRAEKRIQKLMTNAGLERPLVWTFGAGAFNEKAPAAHRVMWDIELTDAELETAMGALSTLGSVEVETNKATIAIIKVWYR